MPFIITVFSLHFVHSFKLVHKLHNLSHLVHLTRTLLENSPKYPSMQIHLAGIAFNNIEFSSLHAKHPIEFSQVLHSDRHLLQKKDFCNTLLIVSKQLIDSYIKI